jgi:hypothetical protein
MKTIKSILDNASELIQDNLTERFGEKCLERQINPPLDQALKEISELIDGVIVDVQPIQMFRNIPDSSTTRTAQDLQVETIARTIIAKQLNNLKELLK